MEQLKNELKPAARHDVEVVILKWPAITPVTPACKHKGRGKGIGNGSKPSVDLSRVMSCITRINALCESDQMAAFNCGDQGQPCEECYWKRMSCS